MKPVILKNPTMYKGKYMYELKCLLGYTQLNTPIYAKGSEIWDSQEKAEARIEKFMARCQEWETSQLPTSQ